MENKGDLICATCHKRVVLNNKRLKYILDNRIYDTKTKDERLVMVSYLSSL
jgi:hypothetical protein